MTEDLRVRRRHHQRIKDVRGRAVTQVDPVAMYLLRQYDIIDADVLRAIAGEKGVRLAGRERVFLIVGVFAALLVIGFFFEATVTRGIRSAPFAKICSLMWFCAVPWVLWYRAKRTRFEKVAAAMLRYLHCPHCAYDLRMLPTDPADGSTVCPECGCAWSLPPSTDTHPPDKPPSLERSLPK